MDTLITDAFVMELTENYSDVSDLGAPTFCPNNSYNCDTDSMMNLGSCIMAVMYNWFNVLFLNNLKSVFIFAVVFIVYLITKCIFYTDVNENHVFLVLYITDARRQLNFEIFKPLAIAVVYFAIAGVYNAVDPFAYAILYFVMCEQI